MPILADKSSCTGCNACYSVCNIHNAITMEVDGMGFYYPKVDQSKCVECKLCEKACPIINNSTNQTDFNQICLAAQMIDKEKLAKSQSGGAFQSIAHRVLENGGVVYGAGFDESGYVKHIRIVDTVNLDNILESKYVESDITDTMRQAKTDLAAGRTVLYSGTPCQIAGLKRVIPEKLHRNLFTIDLICHGVPSPAVYLQYREYLEHKYGKRIMKFIFRDKARFGWRTPRESVIFEDGEVISRYFYNFLFQEKNLIIRKACENCRFCNLQREGDITVADCWGWEKLGRDDFEENRGISLIIVNSDKGDGLLMTADGIMKMTEVSLRPYLLQPNLRQPTPRPPLADKVARDFEKYGFEYINKKYGYTPRNVLRYGIKRFIGKINRKICNLFEL